MMPIEKPDHVNLGAEKDQSAVTAVRNGDADRYRELVERHERQVFAVAWSRLGDAALAEEVTQEAFIRAYQRLWLLGDGAKFSGWVNTIARRVAINFGLRHRRELNKRERWALANRTEGSADEADALHTPETLRQTLAELPAMHRECLVLFYLEDKSSAETAAALGISEGALRVRLNRARTAMRARLEEKLEGSLSRLRPTTSLVPNVMGGVLASSSGKAATGSATVMGILAKFGIAKWLLPFTAFFSFLIFLPMLAFSWLLLRMDLKNFRDQKGFRARLFSDQIRWGMLWYVPMFLIFWILMPRIDLGSWQTLYLILAGLGLLRLPFQIKQLAINRSRYCIATTAASGIVFLALLLAGLGSISFTWCLILIVLQPLVMFRYQNQQPRRMDYNLFLRAAEGLLITGEAPAPMKRTRTPEDLLAFARFLGTRWLAQSYRRTKDGLQLNLIPAKAVFIGPMGNLPSWGEHSHVSLSEAGEVTAHLGQKDSKVLRRLQGENLPSKDVLENEVAKAVELAWNKFAAGDLTAAERGIGEVPDADIFYQPQARTVSTRVQRGILIGSLLFGLASVALVEFYTGSFPVASLQDLFRYNYKRAMNELKVAKTEEKRFYALGDVAKESFVAGKTNEARAYAEELAALTPKYKADWNYGNAIQDANLVLGRLAVQEGNLAAAKKYLIASAKSHGSPQMNSFGPNFTLANDLLKKDQRDTVLEYLMMCRRFWKRDHGQLERWMQEVMAGKNPNFGANLLY